MIIFLILTVTFLYLELNEDNYLFINYLKQLFRNNRQPYSEFLSIHKVVKDYNIKKETVIYTLVGCTFDSTLCSYLSTCSKSIKVCDKSSNHSDCWYNSNKIYTYDQLTNKHSEFLNTLCMNPKNFKKIWAKVDDDVLISREQLLEFTSSIDANIPQLIGFLRKDVNNNIIWPQGSLYIFTGKILEEICNSNKLTNLGGKYEDITIGSLMNLPNTQFINIENYLSLQHLNYKSNRVMIQYLQYGKC